MAIIKDIVERRVNTTGVSEPRRHHPGRRPRRRRAAGRHRPEAVRKLVGQTGRLDFVPLGQTTGDRGPGPRPQAVPAAVQRRPGRRRRRSAPTRTAGPRSTSSSRTTARSKFADYTANHVGDYFAITLDGARHLGAGHPELDPERQRPDHRRRAGRLQRQGRRRTSSRSSSSARCRSRSQALSSEQISATLGSQFLDPDRARRRPSGSCWSSPSCSSTTGCRAASRASRSSTTRS